MKRHHLPSIPISKGVGVDWVARHGEVSRTILSRTILTAHQPLRHETHESTQRTSHPPVSLSLIPILLSHTTILCLAIKELPSSPYHSTESPTPLPKQHKYPPSPRSNKPSHPVRNIHSKTLQNNSLTFPTNPNQPNQSPCTPKVPLPVLTAPSSARVPPQVSTAPSSAVPPRASTALFSAVLLRV
ncbi:hypothetical protein P280DRAFT_241493 [Massarina eburnea CBS 473.64]|uniref:Uncharacterized protein n=1 Tax=Massarina eburnea CBS 473.64 TaxID=1395130 RepID=A0A6A6S7K5_9PLEO|nr:hypothetical protein P280DRAFT_241493 [Massarina eburnea CBS 473.64]